MTLRPLSILIVEDDPVSNRMLAQYLVRYGEVVITKNAREAIANHTVEDPDIIFLDIHYDNDDYDGFDVLRDILSANPDAFVVMFSSDAKESTRQKALALGARGFIAKPFHPDAFAHYITQCR